MAIEVVWSEEAQETFEKNVQYLQQEWSDKEVRNFIEQTYSVINRVGLWNVRQDPSKLKF